MATLRRSATATGVTLAALCIATLFCPVEALSAQDGYVIVISSDNPATELTARDISRVFHKTITRWPNGEDAVPVDLPQHSTVRAAFTQSIHQKSVSDVNAYWQSQIFSGRRVPPVEKATDVEVLAYVAANVNAICYVTPGVEMPANVKLLRVIESAAQAVTADQARVYTEAVVDELPERLSGPALRYPSRLRRAGIEGAVVLEFIVGLDGRVETNSIVSGEGVRSEFVDAATQLIRKSIYRPGRIAGTRVRVRVQQRIRFRMSIVPMPARQHASKNCGEDSSSFQIRHA